MQTLCYDILIHINIIMATCKQSRFDFIGLILHHASFVFSAQVIFCKWLLLLLFKPDGLYVWLISKQEHAQNTAGWVNEYPQTMGIIDG